MGGDTSAGGWTGLRLRSGRTTSVRYGGLAARPVLGDGPLAEGSGWSLGPLEDLLWARLPALRVSLAGLVAGELERAVETDRVLWSLSPYETCSLFMQEVFRPALEGVPDTTPLLRTCGEVLREIVDLDGSLGGCYWDPVAIRVLEWLEVVKYQRVLAVVDPPLADAVEAWTDALSPPPGPAAVLDGPGADRGGNPLRVPGSDVGWGWVEIDAGGGRVAVERFGGVVSWALLNVAPEPVEQPMDLGLGPLADLVWTALPEARPALAELALAAMDAAILADRPPLAVPGAAVAAVIAAPLRDEFDQALQGWSGAPESVRRCARTMSRLLDVDARLTGRHHGEVLAAFRWAADQPYAALLAEADPTLARRVSRR